MSEWEPNNHHPDPTVNALLNIAESIAQAASAIDDLNYAFKFGKKDGLSVAEALEVGAQKAAEQIASAIRDVASEMATREDEP
jgi:hypothetical protein